MPYLGASPRNINTRSVIDHQEYLGSQADTSTNSGYYTFYVNYTPGNVSVVIRGVHMASSDYTATNGTDVRISTSTITLANDDVIEIIGYGIPSSQILERSDVNITGGQAINLTQVGASSYKVGNTEVIDSSGNLISGTLGANVSFANIADDAISGDKIHSGTISSSTLDGIKLKSSGNSITKSDGTTAVLSESGGEVTLQNISSYNTKNFSETDPFEDSSQIAFYNFSNFSVDDVMGNYNGTIVNGTYDMFGPSLLDDITDKTSMLFNGTTYFSIPAINITTFSISFWMWSTNIQTNAIFILGNQNGGQGQLANYQSQLQNYDSGSYYTFAGTPQLLNNKIYHIVWTANATVDNLYVNTVDYGTSGGSSGTTLNNTIYVGTASTQLGSATYAMKGMISNIRIFNKTLNTTEVSTLYGKKK